MCGSRDNRRAVSEFADKYRKDALRGHSFEVLQRSAVFSLRLNSQMLLFALEEHPIEQQQDHRADDGHNPARWLSGLVPADGLAEVSGNECASDAEQNRDDNTTRIFSRHQ